MKKQFVTALVLALGISGTALAANPFSDVPAGHWAMPLLPSWPRQGLSMVILTAPIKATVP